LKITGSRAKAHQKSVYLYFRVQTLSERKPSGWGGSVLCPRWKMLYEAKLPETLLGVVATAESKKNIEL
jgi:hypothetical protein